MFGFFVDRVVGRLSVRPFASVMVWKPEPGAALFEFWTLSVKPWLLCPTLIVVPEPAEFIVGAAPLSAVQA